MISQFYFLSSWSLKRSRNLLRAKAIFVAKRKFFFDNRKSAPLILQQDKVFKAIIISNKINGRVSAIDYF